MKVSKEVVEGRPDEIIDAAVRLYREKTLKEITLREISELTSISRPSISSVDTNLSRMSSQCVRTLEDAMAGRPAKRMTELPYELVIRESTP